MESKNPFATPTDKYYMMKFQDVLEAEIDNFRSQAWEITKELSMKVAEQKELMILKMCPKETLVLLKQRIEDELRKRAGCKD